MVMSTKEIGLMIKQMAPELTNMLEVLDMKENGSMISKMAMVMKHGLMAPNISDSINKGGNMEMAL